MTEIVGVFAVIGAMSVSLVVLVIGLLVVPWGKQSPAPYRVGIDRASGEKDYNYTGVHRVEDEDEPAWQPYLPMGMQISSARPSRPVPDWMLDPSARRAVAEVREKERAQ